MKRGDEVDDPSVHDRDDKLRAALDRYNAAYRRVHSAYDGECEHGFGPPALDCPSTDCPDRELAAAWSALALYAALSSEADR